MRMPPGGYYYDPGILQYGSPAEVQDEVRHRLADLAPGGGFVFGSIHNIQVNVPPANIVAMFDTAREAGRYRAARHVA
jgi:uroporphyrinogen decarboxylase